MSTPPTTQRIPARRRLRLRRALLRLPAKRMAWLVADLVAIVACAVLLLHSLV
jgi:hypothetical protein